MTRAAALPAQAPGRPRIALLGAAGTGKTTLAGDLATHLRERGLRAVVVPEVLEEWCAREGRAPRAEERLAIAREQESRVEAAAAAADIVIADTTALRVALHAGAPCEDDALQHFALEAQRRYDATLLTGLDLAGTPDAPPRAAASREPVDTLLREHLQRAGVAYQVVYGQGPQRLRSALQALAASGVLPPALREREGVEEAGGANWVWVCDKCSDPACEHRLFTKLRNERG